MNEIGVAEYMLKLGKEYFYKGIINIPQKQKHLVPEGSGITVKIYLEKSDQFINGTFTRSGSTTKIYGFEELVNWYGKNFNLNDAVIVQILKKDELKLLIPSKNQ